MCAGFVRKWYLCCDCSDSIRESGVCDSPTTVARPGVGRSGGAASPSGDRRRAGLPERVPRPGVGQPGFDVLGDQRADRVEPCRVEPYRDGLPGGDGVPEITGDPEHRHRPPRRTGDHRSARPPRCPQGPRPWRTRRPPPEGRYRARSPWPGCADRGRWWGRVVRPGGSDGSRVPPGGVGVVVFHGAGASRPRTSARLRAGPGLRRGVSRAGSSGLSGGGCRGRRRSVRRSAGGGCTAGGCAGRRGCPRAWRRSGR